LLAAALAAPSTARAVEVAARLGLSTPAGSDVALGPSAGFSLSLPIRGRLGLLTAADFSSHRATLRQDIPIDSLTLALGVEASIDLAPIVPVLAVGPAFQHAWRRGSPASADSFGGFLSVGVRATVLEHLRLGLQARYLTAGFTSESFPAFVTFVVEVGWTSSD
jgi:hypothetical protein